MTTFNLNAFDTWRNGLSLIKTKMTTLNLILGLISLIIIFNFRLIINLIRFIKFKEIFNSGISMGSNSYSGKY